MSSRKQLLVLSTTVLSLMFGATVGVAAQPEFDWWCDSLKGTGAGYGLCRAGVAVGCVDGTGNAQACANIEDHFLTVSYESAPWVCPCDFEQVPKGWPPSGPWSSPISCQDIEYSDGSIQYWLVSDSLPTVLLAAGEDNNGELFCSIQDGQFEQGFAGLSEQKTAGCLSNLETYWDDLLDSAPSDVTVNNDCVFPSET